MTRRPETNHSSAAGNVPGLRGVTGRSSCSSSIRISFSERSTAPTRGVLRLGFGDRSWRSLRRVALRPAARGLIDGQPIGHGNQHVGSAERGHREDAAACLPISPSAARLAAKIGKSGHKKPSPGFIGIDDVQQHIKRHAEQQGIGRLPRAAATRPRPKPDCRQVNQEIGIEPTRLLIRLEHSRESRRVRCRAPPVARLRDRTPVDCGPSRQSCSSRCRRSPARPSPVPSA